MKRLAIYSHVAKSTVWELIIYDRLQTLRHSTTRNRREYLFWSRKIHYAKKEARCQHTLKTRADEVSPPTLHVPFPHALLFYLRSHCQISVLRIHYHF